jgi:cytochrome c oxidase subunit 3
MVTTATSTKGIGTRERERPVISPLGGPRNGGGNGSRGNGGGGGGGSDRPEPRYRGDRALVAVRVALCSILMLFVALTSAYIVLSSSEGWRPVAIPRWLWLSTALIILSSITFHTARGYLKQDEAEKYRRWLLLTTLLGLGFIGSQLLAWRELAAQGVYLKSNTHSTFFFVLTGTHGLHLLGGVMGLGYLLIRAWQGPWKREAALRRNAAASAVGIYWHFMDGLWVYLFLLLFLWR